MNMKKISHEMNLQKWTQIVEECRNSGKKAVCNELAIANNNVETSPAFTEIMLPGTRKSEVAITLNLNNISLQIHNGADESVISQTLKVLRNLC